MSRRWSDELSADEWARLDPRVQTPLKTTSWSADADKTRRARLARFLHEHGVASETAATAVEQVAAALELLDLVQPQDQAPLSRRVTERLEAAEALRTALAKYRLATADPNDLEEEALYSRVATTRAKRRGTRGRGLGADAAYALSSPAGRNSLLLLIDEVDEVADLLTVSAEVLKRRPKGRPRRGRLRDPIAKLAEIWTNATGRKPTITRSDAAGGVAGGAFKDFCQLAFALHPRGADFNPDLDAAVRYVVERQDRRDASHKTR